MSEKISGWTDCGTDRNGKQVLVQLMGLRAIEIKTTVIDNSTTVETVTLYHTVSDAPTKLNADHSKQFLIAAGLRQVESNLVVLPDAESRLPLLK